MTTIFRTLVLCGATAGWLAYAHAAPAPHPKPSAGPASNVSAGTNADASNPRTAFADALFNPGNSGIARIVTLRSLGVHDVVTLDSPRSAREYYFPVPADVPLTNAQLQLDADYLRADGGRTTLLVSIDGSPSLARALTQPQGDTATSVGVSGDARPGGYVRVGLAWASLISDAVCADQTAIGNLMHVAPTTRLSYRYDSRDVKDLRTAWSGLPPAPTIAISANRIDAAHYDTAWRVAALMQRDGREPVVRAWPAVGDTVDLATLNVPAALRALPAFAALATATAGAPAGKHRLANPAEVAALLVAGNESTWPVSVIVADDAWRASLAASFDALREQAAHLSSDAADAFDVWHKRTVAPLLAPLAPGETRLAHLAGQAVIVLGDTRATGVLAQAWRPVNVSDQLIVHDIDSAANGKSDRVALAALGGQPGTIDVLRDASWGANFDLGAVGGAGRLPDSVVLDLAGTPNTRGAGVVASIFVNDVLIGAKLLDTDGHPQRVAAHIPRYALAARNQLRVSFQRQSDAGCATAQGYPVAVLPDSHLTLAHADGEANFTGLVGRFAASANLIVPAAYLSNATGTVLGVARLADAAGVAPQRASLSVAPDGQPAAPGGPFLAIDVPLVDAKSHVRIAGTGLTILGPDGATLYDVGGVANLRGIGVIDVQQSGGATGVVYRHIGPNAPVLPAGLQLARGDVAVIDSSGVLKLLDTLHADGVETDTSGTPWTRQWLTWVVPAAVVALFAGFVLLTVVVRRRRQRDRDAG
ncbi:cellulose synthase [Paraburkholderia sp.]|uniref:cellulose synthase n=1 Tax=Paraburkholderia sp. TaxID=1926495 RepID=UPI002382BEF7|nr:cellulose synthase [Paraburkholderia sp.]MDE1180518.1 cellulose synthase [Paraburkholderia sp.]